jgi:ADP-dependent NAD(P)H-hydrate dehydratase / NAD(P)H-hydrate epimerase
MKSILFNKEVLDAEKKIITGLNIPSLLLMENAGRSSSEYINKYVNKFKISKIIILAGKGNNAGDGFVIARHLVIIGLNVTVLLLFDEKELKGDARVNYEVIKNLSHKYKNLKMRKLTSPNILKREMCDFHTLVIDSVFGIGFKGELDKNIKEVFNFVKSLKSIKVIAIDTISGLEHYNNAGDCLNADVTLSMGVKKFNSIFWEGKKQSGTDVLMDIGIPPVEFDRYNIRKIYETEKSDIKKFLPVRDVNSNKYSNGKLFVLSGSKGFTGASYLCSLAALKLGSGAVILGIPDSLNVIMEKKLTEVITLPLNETRDKSFSLDSYSKICEKIRWSDSVLIGPGIGRNKETLELIRKIILENDFNLVLDADGLFAFKDNMKLLKNRKKKIILTPHYGEFANLSGYDLDTIKNNIYETSTKFAREYGVILVLKNSPTIITDGKYFYINPTGRENLATVGSGDVLAGIISGFYSQTDDAMMSAVAGVYLHGLCGDILYDLNGNSSTLASDLINVIVKAKKEIVY